MLAPDLEVLRVVAGVTFRARRRSRARPLVGDDRHATLDEGHDHSLPTRSDSARVRMHGYGDVGGIVAGRTVAIAM